MEILFCGTAAAEGWPALFCTCHACQLARKRGGKNLRSRAAYMLGERVRIDLGPDSNLHQQKYGLAYERLGHLLFTHSHDDHLLPEDLLYRHKGFSVVSIDPLQVWGNEAVEKRLQNAGLGDWQSFGMVFHRLGAWAPIDLGEGLSATPVLAAHDRAEECVNFLIETQDGRRALIGHDTGWYDEPTWSFLSGKPLDLLVLDCTYGLEDNANVHMGGLSLIRARDELAKRGALATDARCIATHFSHNGGVLHEELEAFFAPYGFEVAFDGMRVSI